MFDILRKSGLLADVGKDTAIDIQHVTIDSVRSMRCQEDGRTTQLLRIEPASGRCLGADEAIERVTAAIGLLLTSAVLTFPRG